MPIITCARARAKRPGLARRVSLQPPASLHPDFRRRESVHVAHVNPAHAGFETGDGRGVSPEWIALARSALTAYAVTPPEVMNLVARQYTLAATFVGVHGPEASGWFVDQQDAFYLPFADFSARDRPGPDIRLYRRR